MLLKKLIHIYKSIKQEFQYFTKVRLFDNWIIFELIIMLQLQQYYKNFQLTS